MKVSWPCHEACNGSRGLAPLFLNLCHIWRCVVNITLRAVYPRERNLLPTAQEVGWVLETVWTVWRRAKSIASSWIQILGLPFFSSVTTPTTLPRSLCLKELRETTETYYFRIRREYMSSASPFWVISKQNWGLEERLYKFILELNVQCLYSLA